jgi:spoIIIJ-associated protein
MSTRAKKSGPISDLAKRAQEITQGALDRASISGKALVAEDSEMRIMVEVVTTEAGLIIGAEGETLNAIQTLVRAITSVDNTERVPIMIDCQGYRGRREETLREQAQALAEQVKETGKEAVMEGLTAYERRIVHLALQEYGGVSTYSEGEGGQRHLIVSPAE